MADYAKSAPVDPYREECDYRTIQQAAEVMADKIRMKGVLRQHDKQTRAKVRLSSMLAGYRTKGAK